LYATLISTALIAHTACTGTDHRLPFAPLDLNHLDFDDYYLANSAAAAAAAASLDARTQSVPSASANGAPPMQQQQRPPPGRAGPQQPIDSQTPLAPALAVSPPKGWFAWRSICRLVWLLHGAQKSAGHYTLPMMLGLRKRVGTCLFVRALCARLMTCTQMQASCAWCAARATWTVIRPSAHNNTPSTVPHNIRPTRMCTVLHGTLS
jgi:hypothetical protein